MLKPWQLVLLLAVVATAFFLARRFGGGPPEPQADTPPTWILHYVPSTAGRAVYADLLQALPPGDRVVIVTGNQAAREEARRQWPGRAMADLAVADTLSPWARDRYLCIQRGTEMICLARPADSLPANQRGDGAVPDLLRRAGLVRRVIRTAVAPVGGDTILTPRHVLVGELSVSQARQASGGTDDTVLAELERLFGRSALRVPSDALGIDRLHLDMFIGHAGADRLVVGDPRLALAVVTGSHWTHARLGTFHRTRNEAIARGLDEVAGMLTTAGYEIERVPLLVSEPGLGGLPPIVLTWTNAVTREGTVFLPSYGVQTLDDAGAAVWRSLGFEVTRIRCDESIRAGGAVRCLLQTAPW